MSREVRLKMKGSLNLKLKFFKYNYFKGKTLLYVIQILVFLRRAAVFEVKSGLSEALVFVTPGSLVGSNEARKAIHKNHSSELHSPHFLVQDTSKSSSSDNYVL